MRCTHIVRSALLVLPSLWTAASLGGCGAACECEESVRSPPPVATSDQPAAGAPLPATYADLMIAAREPNAKPWLPAVRALADAGDGFTLRWLAGIDEQRLTAEELAALRDTRARIEARWGALGEAGHARAVQAILERTVYADLVCVPFEMEIKPWAVAELRGWSHEEAVQKELERLVRGYEPDPERAGIALNRGFAVRLQRYARAVLEG
jgi:hypothetical protein